MYRICKTLTAARLCQTNCYVPREHLDGQGAGGGEGGAVSVSCCILGEHPPSRQGCDRGAEGKKVHELLSERVCVCGQGQG